MFGPSKVAVLVDGSFWHGCPEHGSQVPKENQRFWLDKISANKARDADTDERLTADGWVVIRMWEHEDARIVAGRVADAVLRRRPG